MKSFLFSAKIAGLFALAMVVVLGSIFALFVHLAADEMVEELGLLRAYEGVATARLVEAELAKLDGGAGSFDHPAVQEILERESRARPFGLWLHPGAEAELETRRGMTHRHSRWLDVEGRRCHVLGPPSFETHVPVLAAGKTVAWLEVEGAGHLDAIHRGFRTGLFQIGVVAFLSIAALAVYLTHPLRRMSQAMDKIAAGELDHRVPVRGGDEVAQMGHSFNAMANRIAGMLAGQKELMAGVSHELRSPLTRMRLSLELFRDQFVSASAEPGGEPLSPRRLDEIAGEIDALDGLVGELLLFSRLELGGEQGSLALDLGSVDLAEVADDAWHRVEDEARETGMHLDLDIVAGAETVRADRRLLERLLGNLFENGIRHARRGDVRLRARPHPDDPARVEIRVADAGPGVPEALRDRLFEPFFRADPSRSRGTGGVGLGLMIVRRAVEAHGGTITARPSDEGGLEIVFDLAGLA